MKEPVFFLKVFSPKNSRVAIACNCRHISCCSFSPPFLGGEKEQPEICLRLQARGATKAFTKASHQIAIVSLPIQIYPYCICHLQVTLNLLRYNFLSAYSRTWFIQRPINYAAVQIKQALRTCIMDAHLINTKTDCLVWDGLF